MPEENDSQTENIDPSEPQEEFTAEDDAPAPARRGFFTPRNLGISFGALAVLLVIRPVTGWIGLLGWAGDRDEKRTWSFFGIRGVGSIYYLAYGINHMPVADAEHLRAIVGLIILLSILLHGLTVTPIMRSLDERRGVDPEAKGAPPPGLQGPAL